MEVFHRAADLIGLDRRVRMELEEPDYEHIFYVTVKLHTRLLPLPQYELQKFEALTLRYMYRLKPLVGPDLDIPAPDVGTDANVMGLLLRQYTDGERERHRLRGIVTGKDTRIGGSEGRVRATGQGLAYTIQEWFADRGSVPAGSTFTLQGFGNVGSNAAEILVGLGSRLLAVNDAGGTIYNPNGIDVRDLVSYVYENPSNLRRPRAGYAKAQE